MLHARGKRRLESSVWLSLEGRMSAVHSGFIRKTFLRPSAAFDSGSQIAWRCRSQWCLNRCCSWEICSERGGEVVGGGWGEVVGGVWVGEGGVQSEKKKKKKERNQKHTGRKPLFREQEARGGAAGCVRAQRWAQDAPASMCWPRTGSTWLVFLCHWLIPQTWSLDMIIYLLDPLWSTHTFIMAIMPSHALWIQEPPMWKMFPCLGVMMSSASCARGRALVNASQSN